MAAAIYTAQAAEEVAAAVRQERLRRRRAPQGTCCRPRSSGRRPSRAALPCCGG